MNDEAKRALAELEVRRRAGFVTSASADFFGDFVKAFPDAVVVAGFQAYQEAA